MEGQAVYRLCQHLRDEGWHPDVIISHIGFGNGLYLSDCFPNARRVGLAEWFYNPLNSDVDFLPNSSLTDDEILRLRTWNAECLLEISSLDKLITPTEWQKSQFPAFLLPHIQVLHEGVDHPYLSKLKRSSADNKAKILPNRTNAEVLTYVSRCFEEYRGFPQVAETISELLMQRPNLHIFMVGSDCAAYGNPRPDGQPWSKWAIDNYNFPQERVHWTGPISEPRYHQILSISDVHIYLTVPFVLSWSLLEAMSVGLPIVASNTPPVAEVIQHMQSGILVDFFDVQGQVDAINMVLDNRSLSSKLASSAQISSADYSCHASLVSWESVLSA